MTNARWIWLNKENTPNEYVAFYENLRYDGGKVFIDISVVGDYNIFVNGKLASFGQYADYKHYKVYDKIELTNFLSIGENKIEIVVWYWGIDAFTGYAFDAGAIYEIYDKNSVLCYSKSGTCCNLYGGYVSHENKLITAQIGFSYTLDTRWKGADYFKAVEIETLNYDLNIRSNKKLVLSEYISAKLIDAKKDIYDLGKECAGFLKTKIKGKNGSIIKVRYGEHLADGEVRSKIGARDFSVEIICNGEEADVFASFRRLGCRYLQIERSADVEIFEIGIIEPLYPFEKVEYKTQNALRQKIYDVSVRTLELCAHEHYEDCPWREQSMYLLDSRNQMLCGYYAFKNSEFQKAAIELFSQGQRDSGLFEICFPAKCEFTIPSFSLIFPWIVLEYTQAVQDITLAKKVLPKIDKLLKYFTSKIDDSGLFKTISSPDVWHFYEWIGDLDGNFFSEDESKKNRNCYDSLINAYLSLALEKSATIYGMLGDNQKADELRQIKDKLNDAIFKMFYDSANGLFKTYNDKNDYSTLANSLCILCGACPNDKAEKIAEKIANSDELLLKNTLSMNVFRFDALLKVDKEKYSKYVLDEIDRVFGAMLNKGATSFWETELGESDFDGAGSLCHGWSAIPVYYFNVLGENGDRKPTLWEK